MKTLYIDTHKDIHIALLNEIEIISEKKIIEQKENSTFLMDTIIDVINNSTYDQIIVVNGPGSFTGVRLGITIAKTLAYTQNIPIKAISYLEVISACVDKSEKKVGFSDKNGYFIGEFDLDNNKTKEFYYIDNKNFENIETDVTLEYDFNFKRILEYANNLDTLNPHNVNPIYVKKIEVEK